MKPVATERPVRQMSSLGSETLPRAAEEAWPHTAEQVCSLPVPKDLTRRHRFISKVTIKLNPRIITVTLAGRDHGCHLRNPSLPAAADFPRLKPAHFLSHGWFTDERNLDTDTTVWVTGFLAFLPLSCKEKLLFLGDLLVLITFR